MIYLLILVALALLVAIFALDRYFALQKRFHEFEEEIKRIGESYDSMIAKVEEIFGIQQKA